MFIFPKIIKYNLVIDAIKLQDNTRLHDQLQRKLISNEKFYLREVANATNTSAYSIKMVHSKMEKFYLINTNLFVCKIMYYMYKVFLMINSCMTLIFSLERALAINAPMKMRRMRLEHKLIFKMLITLVVSYCFLYPAYYLYLLDIIKLHNGQQCRIQNESLYFKFTIMFVFQTLALPFLLITTSNILILFGLERNRRKLEKKFSQDMPTTSYSTNKSHSLNSTRHSAAHVGFRRRGKTSRITKIFLAISISFVLLRFPYFIAWCRFSILKVYYSKPYNEKQRNELKIRNEMVDFTVILNLFDYALTGLLYFATGKSFQDNLHACFGVFYTFFGKMFRCKLK